MSFVSNLISFITGKPAAQLPQLTGDDFVDLKTGRTVKQQAIIDRVQTLFSGKISESVVYGTTDLSSCGKNHSIYRRSQAFYKL
jgi:hypothetical protein